MGVPAFFRWLVRKYPKIQARVIETRPAEGDDRQVMAEPNPNGKEFDNLYLDMNGIVHPCTHPESGKAPPTEEAMMLAIFKYTDRVVNMVRPRKLLMIAVDGVAPRAKMNQQRSRRFRSAQEAEERRQKAKEIDLEIMERNPGVEIQEHYEWDSNAITPGTTFMDLLTTSLRFWIQYKLNTDPGWAKLKVILSPSQVPGEGEHKIMQFIRAQRSASDYNPNTHHVIYGLDADLIMLGLATHEPYFSVLREDVFFQDSKQRNSCRICGQQGHYASECTGKAKEKKGDFDEKGQAVEKPFLFCHVNILREYLTFELTPSTPLHFPFDIERAIDDFIFLCFFVGNDFLPHLPSLDIREGAIDQLVRFWRDNLGRLGGYITEDGSLDLDKVKIILEKLGKEEDEIFRKRHDDDIRKEANMPNNQSQSEKNRKVDMIQERLLHEIQESQSSSERKKSPEELLKKLREDKANRDLTKAKLQYEVPTVIKTDASNTTLNDKTAEKANKSIADSLRAELDIDMSDSPTNEVDPAIDQTIVSNTNEATTETGVDPSNADSSQTKRSRSVAQVMRESAPVADSISSDESLPKRTKLDKGATKSKKSKSKKPTKAELEAEKNKAIPKFLSALGKRGDAQNKTPAPLDLETILGRSKPSQISENPTPAVNDVDEAEEEQLQEEKEILDDVRLWEAGFKDRYYTLKFHRQIGDVAFRTKVAQSYCEGLSWVLLYYYQGCPSWTWFYPYHYSPFASDFAEVDPSKIKFEKGQPFRPIEQLLGVLPAASKQLLPEVFRELMTSEESDIIDFYPEDFELDMNGKKFHWLAVVLLPFIEERRLLEAAAKRYPLLNEEENARNEPGVDTLFLAEQNKLYKSLANSFYTRKSSNTSSFKRIVQRSKTKKEDLVPNGDGLFGSVKKDDQCLPHGLLSLPFESDALKDVNDDLSLSMPQSNYIHKSMLLKGLKMPTKVLTDNDRQSIKEKQEIARVASLRNDDPWSMMAPSLRRSTGHSKANVNTSANAAFQTFDQQSNRVQYSADPVMYNSPATGSDTAQSVLNNLLAAAQSSKSSINKNSATPQEQNTPWFIKFS